MWDNATSIVCKRECPKIISPSAESPPPKSVAPRRSTSLQGEVECPVKPPGGKEEDRLKAKTHANRWKDHGPGGQIGSRFRGGMMPMSAENRVAEPQPGRQPERV